MRIGFCICGSFCTFHQVFPVMEALAQQHTIVPIFSPASYTTDTRFGTAQAHIRRATEICGTDPLYTVAQVEPIGPKKLLDVLVIAPCTGNTLAKLAAGITDSPVTMAVKAQLRKNRPVVIALATNDALSANLKNIGHMLSRKHVYFVPMRQDDPEGKPHSLVCEFDMLKSTMTAAFAGRQKMPIF